MTDTDEITRLRAEIERLRAALTPSAETKAAYIGEFRFTEEGYDEDGQVYYRKVAVPWTIIKEIMAAISARAALAAQPAPSGWRPIETAPKDGTEVLMVFVFDYGEALHRVVRWDASEMWPWRDEYTGYREREAKGWLPLPPAPGKEEA